MKKAYYYLALTPHQRMALMTIIADHIANPDAVEVSIDATTGEELEIGSLLTLVMDAQPTVVDDKES